MRLKNLKIDSFKNLNNLEIDFSSHQGLSLVIGNNASGKSNLLELFSEIFYSQYRQEKAPFHYELNYQTFNKIDCYLTEAPTAKDSLLPNRIIAIYSGEEPRLWEQYYKPFYHEYIQNIREEGNYGIHFPKMLLLNRYYWHISLLSLLLSDADDNKTFLEDQLYINLEDDITITFKREQRDFKNNTIVSFIDTIVNEKVKSKIYSLTELKKILNVESDPELYLKLFIATTDKDHKLLSEINIHFNQGLTVHDLSEGQKKQLLIKGALEFAGYEDTLYLLDEPDAHIHVSNKQVVYDLIEPYVDSGRHIMMTTHSPVLCQLTSNKESIILLENGKKNSVTEQFEVAKYLVNKDDIYKLLFSKKHLLLVEGKTDELYLTKAFEIYKDEYPELDFNIVRMGGTDYENILAFLEEVKLNKEQKAIALVDRDNAGAKAYKQLCNVKSDKEDMDCAEIPSVDNAFCLMLPPPKGRGYRSSDNFMIEDYFNQEILFEKVQELVNVNRFSLLPNLTKKMKSEIFPELIKDADKNMLGRIERLLDKLQQIIKISWEGECMRHKRRPIIVMDLCTISYIRNRGNIDNGSNQRQKDRLRQLRNYVKNKYRFSFILAILERATDYENPSREEQLVEQIALDYKETVNFLGRKNIVEEKSFFQEGIAKLMDNDFSIEGRAELLIPLRRQFLDFYNEQGIIGAGPRNERFSIAEKLVEYGIELGLTAGDPAILVCVATVYGCEATRDILKIKTKKDHFKISNALGDIMSLQRVATVKDLLEKRYADTEIIYRTEDAALENFHQYISVKADGDRMVYNLSQPEKLFPNLYDSNGECKNKDELDKIYKLLNFTVNN